MATKSPTTTTTAHSRIWTTVLRLLSEGNGFAALTVAQFTGAPIDEVRDVLYEMADLGWLEYVGGTWRAGEQATDLLRLR
jgi:DNA-binding IclR family transcriptional regulator